jgi:hypothetical protein
MEDTSTSSIRGPRQLYVDYDSKNSVQFLIFLAVFQEPDSC